MSAAPAEDRAIGPATAREEPLMIIPVELLVWIAVTVLFLFVRAWPIWTMPVGGAELDHLSGAWNASIGVDDDRYVPSLFQALSAALFTLTTSEVPARLVAFAATATLPVALFLLRPWLGLGALIALAVLTIDAASVAVGGGASAMGFDLAITSWLFLMIVRGGSPPWGWCMAAAVVASAGPVPLPLVIAFVATAFLRREPLDWQTLAWPAAGAVAGVVFATLRPGLGPDGLTISPIELFAAGYAEDWSTSDGLDLLLLIGWPILAASLAAAGWLLLTAWPARVLQRWEQVLLLWATIALAWYVTLLPARDVTPLAAATLPLALLLGPSLAYAWRALLAARWDRARYLLPVATAAIAVILFHFGDWAKLDSVGGSRDKLIVSGLALAALAAVGLVASDRRSLPALFGLMAPFAVAPLLVATFAVAFRAGDAPLPSPISSPQARDLRTIALESVGAGGGSIVIHPEFEEELTWPFRDSGNVIIASQVPGDAAFVIWPATAEAPQGLEILAGEWSLVQRVAPPTGGFFEFVRWYSDRYSLAITPAPVAVYVREAE